MKIAMTLLVKNEIDIIKTHINYHLPLIDVLIIMDNCSTDGTFDYLKSLNNDKIIIVTQAAQNYNQKLWVTRMVQMAVRLNVDWVINSDADEFFCGDIRGTIEKASNMGYNQIYPKGSNFYITDKDLCTEKNPVKRMLYRDPLDIKYEHDKVIHSTMGFNFLSQGNHWVFFNSMVQPNILHTSDIKLFHYPIRSWEQFLSKYTDVNQMKINNMGHLWRQQYDVYKTKGLDGLRDSFKQIVVKTEDIINKKLEVETFLSLRCNCD